MNAPNTHRQRCHTPATLFVVGGHGAVVADPPWWCGIKLVYHGRHRCLMQLSVSASCSMTVVSTRRQRPAGRVCFFFVRLRQVWSYKPKTCPFELFGFELSHCTTNTSTSNPSLIPPRVRHSLTPFDLPPRLPLCLIVRLAHAQSHIPANARRQGGCPTDCGR